MRPLLLLVAVSLAACGKPDTSTKSTPIAAEGLERVDIYVESGSVSVNAGGNAVVDAALSWRGDTAPQLTTRVVGGTLLVAGTCPEETKACEIDFDLTVPPTIDVDIVSLDGDVTVTDMLGLVDVEADAGDVALVDLGGFTRVSATAGDVSLEDIAGRLDLYVPDGAVTGTGLNAPTFELRGERTSLEVDFNAQPDLTRIRNEVGDLTLRVPFGAYDVEATSKRGEISITGLTNATDAGSIVLIETIRGDIVVSGK